MKTIKRNTLSGVLAVFLLLSAFVPTIIQTYPVYAEEQVQITNPQNLPAYSDTPYVEVNDNVPVFNISDADNGSFEIYSELDSLGRCGAAYANIGLDLMPIEERGSIGSVKPTGWETIKYDNVDGKYLYNRCHCATCSSITL